MSVNSLPVNQVTDPDADAGFYYLRLYVAGQTVKSLAATANLKRVCEDHLAGRYEIEVIDLLQNPQLPRATRSSPSQPSCDGFRRR